MLESGVTTWELSGTVTKSHSVNLVNAMKTFLSHSKSLLDFPIANLTIHNPSVFYLVRNGLKGELTQALSLSLSLFKDIEQQTINRNVSSILYLLIAVFASLGIAVAISVPVIMRLQVYAGQVSGVFMNLPLAKCLENRRKVVDRLRDKFGVEIEYGIERHKKKESRFVVYRPSGLILLLVAGFLTMSTLLYLVVYFQAISPLTGFVGHLPEAMQLYAQRFAGLIDLWTWTVETIFSTSVWPLSLALPDYSLQLSPAQVLAFTSASLKKNSRDLFMMKQDGYLPFTQPMTCSS